MRGRVIAGGIFSSAAVLVIGWQLGGQPAVTATQPQASTSGGTTSGTGSTGTGSSAGGGTSSGSTRSGDTSSGDTSSGGSGSGSSTESSSGTSGSSTGTTASAKDGTYAGQTAQTQYGPVQVQITVAGGKLTDVTALQLTNDGGRSVMISQQAAPILRQEALQAQSAQIQAVSGATFTSEGYITSLQSALDQAGL
ncbi:FMN-binding protein [Curtobacterium sp. 'Ferrero']|uniref:FMN-binding protein n=1 Tax=Curtobacterium sp. 'Ferrero' TaxID=2033654 RepID=UPI000BC41741|nr:FMN-binding protein [Curtobacterium sp. 'Ferrero']PCN47630.1 FMN-binding protein [Curtobacterium sp. 'Ferrero']